MLNAEQKQALEAEIREFIGRPIGPDRTGRDPVNQPMVNQWCEVMGDALPVYTDADAAAKSVHGGLVAPPTMLQAWTMIGWAMRDGFDEPTNEEQRLHKILTDAGYTGVLGTDIEQEFTRYLRPGDVITDKTVIADISEEKATGAGVGYFITTRTDWVDQDGEPVGWLTFRVLKFIPKDAPQPAADSGAGAQPAAPTRVKPPMGHDNAWWWNAVSDDGILPIQRCKDCSKLRHPPRPMCDACGSLSFHHVAASGKGTLHSFTIIRYPQFPGYDFPIIAALVDLEEGERIVSNVFECEPEDVSIGMKLEMFIHEDPDGFKMPVFRPAK